MLLCLLPLMAVDRLVGKAEVTELDLLLGRPNLLLLIIIIIVATDSSQCFICVHDDHHRHHDNGFNPSTPVTDINSEVYPVKKEQKLTIACAQ